MSSTMVILGGTLVLCGAVLIFIFKIKCEYVLFLHVFGRVVLDSIPRLSYAQQLGGISFMQLYSVAWTAFFIIYLMYVTRGRLLMPNISVAIALLIVSSALSSLINMSLYFFVQSSLKWFYFFSLVLFCVNTIQRSNVRTYCSLLFVAALYPVLNQMVMAAIAGPKVSHGITNYIGSYYHEAGFSSLVLLLIALSLAWLSLAKHPLAKKLITVVVVVLLVSIVMAGYRTALLAGVVLIAVYVFFHSQRNFYHMTAYVLAFTIVCLLGAWASSLGYLDRFKDIAAFISEPGRYLDFSGGGGDRTILTGRIYILNQIMHQYLNADLSQQIAGLGPGMAQQSIGVYAHNEFVSALAEFGIIGLLVFIYLHGRMIQVGFRAIRVRRDLGYLSLAVTVSVIVLSLATMPYHDMRALLYLGIIFAMGDYYSRRVASGRHPVAPPTQAVQGASPSIPNSIR